MNINDIKFSKPKGLIGLTELLESFECDEKHLKSKIINKEVYDKINDGPCHPAIYTKYTEHCIKYMIKRVSMFVIFLVVLLIIKSSLIVVYPGEHVLIKQFGKVSRIVSTPGPTFRIPIYESKEVLPANIIYYDIQKSEGYTADKKNMIIDCYVLWKITDPLKFTQTLQNVDTANYRINTVVYNSMKTLLGTKTQDELIRGRDIIGEDDGVISVVSEDTQNNTTKQPNTDNTVVDNSEQVNIISSSDSEAINITSDMKIDTQLLNTINMEEYGIKVVDIKIKSLDLPAENKDAVYTRMKSERENIATRYRSEGEKDAKMLRNDADAQVPQILAEAKKQAANEIAEGEAKYMQILSNAYNTPEKKEFYNYLRRLDALEKTVDNKKTLILPSDSQLFSDLK